MNPEDLRAEVAVEMQALALTVAELQALSADVAGRQPTIREKTAAAAFLAQFYNGIENVLKRICVYHSVPLPTGETWHIELFQRFSPPGSPPLPELFDEALAADLAPYRRFRHVVFHSYGFELDWARMAEGIAQVDSVFARVKARLSDYLRSLSTEK